jgi:hypothetical protein
MTPLTARSTSIALVGGVAAMLFWTVGLLFWAGVIAWAACMEAGGDSDAVRKTIAGNTFGAVMGWIALTVALLIPVSPEGWVWVPRSAIPVAITLFFIVMATRVPLLSRLNASLYGYGAVFGAFLVIAAETTSLDRLTSVHLYNPVLAVVISMVGGAVCAPVATRLTAALSKG